MSLNFHSTSLLTAFCLHNSIEATSFDPYPILYMTSRHQSKPEIVQCLKVKTSIGNAPISKNEMEAPISNHVKECVLTNTSWYKNCRETAYSLIYLVN